MAINFEAANMAGYNNPKIEVFKVVADLTTNAITSAPSKTEVINCLSRGAIPLILISYPVGSTVYVLWIHSVMLEGTGETIYFSNGSLVVSYSPDSEQPILGTAG